MELTKTIQEASFYLRWISYLVLTPSLFSGPEPNWNYYLSLQALTLLVAGNIASSFGGHVVLTIMWIVFPPSTIFLAFSDT